VLNKAIPKYRRALRKWSGSDHYKNTRGDPEPIDVIASSGKLRHHACSSIIKYAYRILSGSPDELQLRRDLLKIGHFAGLIWEDLERRRE